MIRPIHKFGLWKSSSSLFSWEYSQIDHDDHLMGNKESIAGFLTGLQTWLHIWVE
jgi:hypothetical protein